jgi:hypothetical protein
MENLIKAQCILDTILEDYDIINVEAPNKGERETYSVTCDRLHTLIAIVSDYVHLQLTQQGKEAANE